MNDLKHRRLSIASSLLVLGAILLTSVSASAQTRSCDNGATQHKKAGAPNSCQKKSQYNCKKGSMGAKPSCSGSSAGGSNSQVGTTKGCATQGGVASSGGTGSKSSVSTQGGSSAPGSSPASAQQELQRQQALLNQVQKQGQMQSLLQLLRQNPAQAQQQGQDKEQQSGQGKIAKLKNGKKGKNTQSQSTFSTTTPGSQVTAFGSNGQGQASVSGNAGGNGLNANGQGTVSSGGSGNGHVSVSGGVNGSVRGNANGGVSAGVSGSSNGVSGNVQANTNGGVSGNVRVSGQLGTLRGQTPHLQAQVPRLGVNVQGQLPTVHGQVPNVSANLPTLQLPNGPQIQIPQLPFPQIQLPQLPQLGNLPPFGQGPLPQGGVGTPLPTGQLGQPQTNQQGTQTPQLTPQQRTNQALAAQRQAQQQAMQNALQQQPNNQTLQQQLQQYLPQGGGVLGGNNAGGNNGGANNGGNNGGGQGMGNPQNQAQNLQNNANILQDQTYRTTYMREAAAKARALMADPRKATDDQIQKTRFLAAERMAGLAHQPKNSTPSAKASGQAQANQAGNSAADVAREQAVQAIDYCSRFMKNFTAQGGNKWNRFRDQVFVPMAILILLPGAVVCQVRAIISQGSPIVGQVSPFEGMQRGMIAVFLIPGSYLICNYAIDLGNSIQFTIADEYKRLFQTDMYEDAMCAEIRAFGARYLAENDSSLRTPPWDFTPRNPQGIFAKAEARIWGKLEDPCSGLHLVPANRDDASIESSNTAVRSLLNTTNAAMCTGWSILCAFQMAFFYYLFFVGPIMAALWVWPMKFLRDAFGSWVEGVITLCFWSLFWSTTILLLACFKGTDDTGIFMITAINFLATASVKYAFDFGGLVKAAGQKAAELADKAGDSK